MKILKFLLKPMKYFVLLLAIGALIYYRTIIFHSNVNQYIDLAQSYVEERFDIEIPKHISETGIVNTTAQATATSNTVSQPVELQNQEAPADTTASDLQTTSTGNTDEQALYDSSQLNDKLSLIEVLSETVDVINKKIDMLFDMNTAAPAAEQTQANNTVTNDLAVASEIDTSGNNEQKNNIITAPESDSADSTKMLQIARQSFWNGNTQLSEKYYLNLAQQDETGPDIYGELGNVYYAQGKWKQAGEAYYEAAIRLLETKQNDQVHYLLRVIQGLDTTSAERLRQKISG